MAGNTVKWPHVSALHTYSISALHTYSISALHTYSISAFLTYSISALHTYSADFPGCERTGSWTQQLFVDVVDNVMDEISLWCDVWQQMLEEVCVKNGWGTPMYDLHEVVSIDQRLYAYKVNHRPSTRVHSVGLIIGWLLLVVPRITWQTSWGGSLSGVFAVPRPITPVRMNEWMRKIYITRLKAYKCMLNLPRLTEN